MILESFAINIASSFAQWLGEPTLNDWRRRLYDPQRTAIRTVVEEAARRMLREVASDLHRLHPDLGPGDYERLGAVLGEFFGLPQVQAPVIDAAIRGDALDSERMQTHFRTVRGPEQLIGIPFVLDDALRRFLDALNARFVSAAQEADSPLYNFWSVIVADNMQRGMHTLLERTQPGEPPTSEVNLTPDPIRIELLQADNVVIGGTQVVMRDNQRIDVPTLDDMVAYLAGVRRQYRR